MANKLTNDQKEVITKTLNENNSLIITQNLWNILSIKLDIRSILCYNRRLSNSDFNVRIGYSWDEYQFGVHSTKALVQINCIHCQSLYVALAQKLFYRRHKVNVCPDCYRTIYLYDKEWRANNSASQKIAQNKEETLKKHRENSRLLWIGDHGKIMRAANKLSNSRPDVREKIAATMRKKWEDTNYRDRISGKGSYKHTGKYNGCISYHSKLELAFLLWCTDNNLNVTRCDFGIMYINPVNMKQHKYYPDFIVDNQIIEIKGQRWIDLAPETFAAKINALSSYCDINKCSFKVLLDKDLKDYWKKANSYHEAQKQKVYSI